MPTPTDLELPEGWYDTAAPEPPHPLYEKALQLMPLADGVDANEVAVDLCKQTAWYAQKLCDHLRPKPKELAARMKRVRNAAKSMQRAIEALTVQERQVLFRHLPRQLAARLQGQRYREVNSVEPERIVEAVVSATEMAFNQYYAQGFIPITDEHAEALRARGQSVIADEATGWKFVPKRGPSQGPEADFVANLKELWKEFCGIVPTISTTEDLKTGQHAKSGPFLELCQILANHVRQALGRKDVPLTGIVQGVVYPAGTKEAN